MCSRKPTRAFSSRLFRAERRHFRGPKEEPKWPPQRTIPADQQPVQRLSGARMASSPSRGQKPVHLRHVVFSVSSSHRVTKVPRFASINSLKIRIGPIRAGFPPTTIPGFLAPFRPHRRVLALYASPPTHQEALHSLVCFAVFRSRQANPVL